jgi:hypothetical protein
VPIEILKSSNGAPPQDRVDDMLCWLHKTPDYEKAPNWPEFKEDRQWAETVISDLRRKEEVPKMAEAKQPLKAMLSSVRSAAALYRENRFVLSGFSATADANATRQEKDGKWDLLLAKIDGMVSALDEIEGETQRAYDNVLRWCESRESRRVSSLYHQTIGPPDHELAELAVTKFFERRREISAGPKSACFFFTQLLGAAVKDRDLSDLELLDAHRKAIDKIKAAQQTPPPK